ncbi:MAG: D-alanine--D-alanine ligase [Pirellulales bacterium]
MNVGLTYDLRDDYLARGYSELETAEFDTPATLTAISESLKSIGCQPCRIGNIHALVQRLSAGERWDLVFNIAEGLHGFGREAQVPALLDAFQIPYTFSEPLVLSLTLHKALMKHVVRDLGIPTPRFEVVADEFDARQVRLPFPLFVKPVAEGSSKGVNRKSLVHDAEELMAQCRELLAAYRQPVLVEEYLRGQEFTVGVLGTGAKAYCLGVMEVSVRPGDVEPYYSFENKTEYESRVSYQLASGGLAEELRAMAVRLWRFVGGRDAGRIDFRCDASGTPHFLEINPLAGLNPNYSDLPILARLSGLSFDQLVAEILKSCSERVRR